MTTVYGLNYLSGTNSLGQTDVVVYTSFLPVVITTPSRSSLTLSLE